MALIAQKGKQHENLIAKIWRKTFFEMRADWAKINNLEWNFEFITQRWIRHIVEMIRIRLELSQKVKQSVSEKQKKKSVEFFSIFFFVCRDIFLLSRVDFSTVWRYGQFQNYFFPVSSDKAQIIKADKNFS